MIENISISEEDDKMLTEFSQAVNNATRAQLMYLVVNLTIDGSQEEARGRIKIVKDFLEREV